jgi:CheY-like chemotaxis protein
VSRILVLEDDDDLLALLSDLLAAKGDACVTARSLAELVANGEKALACDLAILDVYLGARTPTGVDAYWWLRKNDFKGRIIFLTGYSASHPLVQDALRLPNVPVLEKPVGLDELVRLTRD